MDMRKLSAKRAAERPCSDEAKISLQCQLNNVDNFNEKCTIQIESYNECMIKFNKERKKRFMVNKKE